MMATVINFIIIAFELNEEDEAGVGESLNVNLTITKVGNGRFESKIGSK